MVESHNLEDCPHNPTFGHILGTLERLDKHGERTAIAMEELAKSSVIISMQGKTIEKHDRDLRELFGRVRLIEQKKADCSQLDAVDVRVKNIELEHAIELGSESIIEKQEAFKDKVKVALLPYIVSIGLFLIYLVDRFELGTKFAKLWKEMKG